MDFKFASGCMICGADLEYLEQDLDQICFYCGRTFRSNARCVEGHYVCDDCHSSDANTLIERFCSITPMTDPVAIATLLMRHPSVAMHGPEHHFLVPAVLLTAYDNQFGLSDRSGKLSKARQRAEGVRGGSCGTCGNCGAAVGTGIFISLLTGATPLSEREWQLSNRMTAHSLMAIAEQGGPRCCKRDTYLALLTTQTFLRDEMGISLQMTDPIDCEFHPRNKQCRGVLCPFHPTH